MALSTITSLDISIGTISLLLSLIIWITDKDRIAPKGLRLPPGPRGRPIIGNVGDIPKHHDWETYTRWAKKYGDLVLIKVLGQNIVFANSMDVAHELLEKRSTLYSDRNHSTMLSELSGLGWNIVLMPYGERWRHHRKVFEKAFNPSVVTSYHELEIKHTRELLRRLHKSSDFVTHIRHYSGAVIMEIIYGIKVLPSGDPYIENAEKVLAAVGEGATPGSFLVDMLPILKYVPEWMPGARFQKKARAWRATSEDMTTLPFMAVKQGLSAGTARPSFTATLLEELSSEGEPRLEAEDVIRDTGAQAYGAGVDSTVSALSSFILAMVLYPEVQRKAQFELDSIIGMERLPNFEDRPHLPYINALCKEVLRWHPVTPLGFPHRLMQDDVYNGYFIPKGSMVFSNTWAIFQDEKAYGPRPEEFIPERFLRPEARDPSIAFGFGRRVCPGRHQANNAIYIAVVSILKVFQISPAIDEDGREIQVESVPQSGIVSHPEPFSCQIKVRSGVAETLIWEHVDE